MTSTEPSADTEAREPCPTPLSWTQVLDLFRADSSSWSVPFGPWTISGQLWGSGPSVCILNDLNCDCESYALLGYLLKDHCRCIFVNHPQVPTDQRGELRAEHLAAFIVAVCDALAEQQISLFASGFGSVAALTLMRDFPDRLDRVVLSSGFASRRLSIVERALLVCGRRSQRRMESIPWRGKILDHNHRRWFPPYDFNRWNQFVMRHGQRPVRELAELASVLREFDCEADLVNMQTPTLVIRTEGEGLRTRAACELLESRLGNATSEWLHTTGELSSLTHPHRMAKLIQDFLLTGPEHDS